MSISEKKCTFKCTYSVGNRWAIMEIDIQENKISIRAVFFLRKYYYHVFYAGATKKTAKKLPEVLRFFFLWKRRSRETVGGITLL